MYIYIYIYTFAYVVYYCFYYVCIVSTEVKINKINA